MRVGSASRKPLRKEVFPKLTELTDNEAISGQKMDLAELTKVYDFTGRSVVITGGTGVLGRVMVKALVGCGHWWGLACSRSVICWYGS